MKRVLCIIIALLLSVSSIRAQNTEGQDFWLTFGGTPNHYTYNLEFQIRIVNGAQPTSVKIDFTHLGTWVDYSMSAYEIFTYTLKPDEKEAVHNTTMGTTDYSIHITASHPVTVYTLKIHLTVPNRNLDASNVLPVPALGTEYYQISYAPSDNSNQGS